MPENYWKVNINSLWFYKNYWNSISIVSIILRLIYYHTKTNYWNYWKLTNQQSKWQFDKFLLDTNVCSSQIEWSNYCKYWKMPFNRFNSFGYQIGHDWIHCSHYTPCLLTLHTMFAHITHHVCSHYTPCLYYFKIRELPEIVLRMY